MGFTSDLRLFDGESCEAALIGLFHLGTDYCLFDHSDAWYSAALVWRDHLRDAADRVSSFMTRYELSFRYFNGFSKMKWSNHFQSATQ